MKYIWMWMLLMIDVIWLISSIVDTVKTVIFVKEHRRYGRVGDFIMCMVDELSESTVGFIALHVFMLFSISLVCWIDFKLGG